MQNKAPAGGTIKNGQYYAGGQFITTRRMADEEAERRRNWEADRRACQRRRLIKDAVNVGIVIFTFVMIWILGKNVL